ncbi:MAG: sugar phosphate isomerase/epimerase family protein [Roseburia sp.]
MSKVLCSTGALIGRPNGRDHKLLKKLSSQLSCDGFEFMMYDSWYEKAEEVVVDLKEMQLNIPVMHCEKHIGEAISRNADGSMEEAFRHFALNCEIAVQLGAEKLVVHLWDGLTSDQNFHNNLVAYQELYSIASDYNIDLLVENVVCNREDPMKHWCELAERYPKIHFVFDTKMAAFHQQLELLYQEKYRWLWEEDHIRHYHVNDYAGGYLDWSRLKTLPIGAGHVDFERFFSFLQKIGYDGTMTVEATAFQADGSVDVEMLNRCFTVIGEQMNQ